MFDDPLRRAQRSVGKGLAVGGFVGQLQTLAAAGKKIYDSESCDACHGENGVGTNAGPKLAGAIAQKSAEELSNVLRHPTAKMIEGEMKPVDVSDEDLKALVAYIKSLK